MTPPPPVPVEQTRGYRRQQARMDRHFWGLVHDHDWLQYSPFRREQPETKPRRR
jgi:hypothetical protein